MKLKSANVKNFRALRDVTVNFEAHTVILGGNGAGKSTILRAIDKFYSPSNAIELDDFHARNTESPIEISLTFNSFSPDELDRFGERVVDGEMTVVRVYEAAGGRSNGRYYGSTLQHPRFASIREANGASDKRTAFNDLRREDPSFGFSAVTRADEIEPQLLAWEAAHREDCVWRRDDGQFFGFSNVGRGNLQKSTSFVFIPAVRDASADALDSRGAVIARLMELVVRSSVQRRADVLSFQARVSREYRELVDPARLTELGTLAGSLTSTLRNFYADSGVALRWQDPEDLAVPLPTADVLLDEDGFQGPVDRKGHGLQRAFIFTLLQHLARATAAQDSVDLDPDVEHEETGEDQSAPFVLPGLILAIEEPELYQHPTKQRHFSKVLLRLTDGSLPGVAAQTQIMFASHSPLFVSPDRFDEIRLARRHFLGAGADKECRLTHSTLEAVAARLETAHQRPKGSFSASHVRAKLHVVGPELAEGFFAELVVVVEGLSDRAALVAAATICGVDLEAEGVAILPADGKTKIDKPAAIFLELGIPVYVVYDSDFGKKDQNGDFNRALQRLMGVVSITENQTIVSDKFATFEVDLETTLKEELSTEILENNIIAVRDEYDLAKRDDVIKLPFTMKQVLTRTAAQGRRSATLEEIVASIMRLRRA